MRKILSFLSSVLFLSYANVYAADLLVQQNGPVGTYASITSAMNASADGDRIVIYNRPGGLSWDENLNVTKALQFVSGDDGVLWIMRGNITISPSATTKLITFIGMDNLLGNMTVGAGAPTGARCRVDVMGCRFNGSANFNTANYNINFVGNTLNNGNLTFTFGRAISNLITVTSSTNFLLNNSTLITVNTDANPTNDSVQIIGNKIFTTVAGVGGITINNNSQFFQIFNNYVSVANSCITINNVKSSIFTRNSIMNNSVLLNSTSVSGANAIYVSSNNPTTGIVDVLNNVADENSSWTLTGLRRDDNVAGDWSYNVVSWDFSSNSMFTGVVNNGTNSLGNTSIVFDQDGRATTGVTDAGHPGSAYTDLNFTRNDAGAYGGSFSLDNFFPTGVTVGSPRVFMLRMPRAIYQGVPVRVEAEGYDR